MTFSIIELSAMVKLGTAVAAADGRIAEEEKMAIAFELSSFGVTQDEIKPLLAAAQAMNSGEAISLVSAMTLMQKKYVTGYLAVVMAADGKVEDSEVKMWSLISMLANLPTMTVSEALDFWNNN